MQTQRIGNLLELKCRCGYQATDLVDGGLMSGVSHLFTCPRCVDVVSALTWSVGILDEHPPGDVEATCPGCGGTELEPWGKAPLRKAVVLAVERRPPPSPSVSRTRTDLGEIGCGPRLGARVR